MCGISGIIHRKGLPVQPEIIREMNQKIAHRGPDGDGFFETSSFAFGHRRLAILDLTEDGKQPMHFANQAFTITFNGEIYNYIELRDELILLGYQFHSKSDTEVILAAYQAWGRSCVNRFNGMWSFAIYDQSKNEIFCSRDRFGVKPFYYTVTEDYFAFGSEIKQLLPFVVQENQVACNPSIVLDYLLAGIEEHTQDTFFKGILKLPAGSNLVYHLESHQFEIAPYYSLQLDKSLSTLSEKESVARYENCLSEAVRLRMRSDVEVGTCLSGGLDSSSITALSAEILRNETGAKIKAIHAKVNEKSIDESDFATHVAKHTDSELILVESDQAAFLKELHHVIELQEEPFGSPSIILQYFVFQKARERNCLVMLDGQGGDETLLGYERYYPAFLKQKKGLDRMQAFFNSSKNSKLSPLDLVKYYFYFTNYNIRLNQLKKRHKYIKSEVLQKYQSDALQTLSANYLDIDQLQILEIQKTQLPHLLKYEDKNSMANSIETRLPFLDYRCVETALSLPHDFKIKNGWTKYLLRKGIESKLPKEIVWRKNKLGFNAPEQRWLASIETEMVQTIQNSTLLNALIDFQKFDYKTLDLRTRWRLFNLAVWEKTFQVTWS